MIALDDCIDIDELIAELQADPAANTARAEATRWVAATFYPNP